MSNATRSRDSAYVPDTDERIAVQTRTTVQAKSDDYCYSLIETTYCYTVSFSDTKEECESKAAFCRNLAFRDLKAKMERLNKQEREFFVLEN